MFHSYVADTFNSQVCLIKKEMFLNNYCDLILWIKLANGIFFILTETTDFTIFYKFFKHYNLSPFRH